MNSLMGPVNENELLYYCNYLCGKSNPTVQWVWDEDFILIRVWYGILLYRDVLGGLEGLSQHCFNLVLFVYLC